MREKLRKRKKLVIIICLCLILALLFGLGVAMVLKRERHRLHEDGRPDERYPSVTAPETPNLRDMAAYQLLGHGCTEFNIFYYGDAALFGQGASDPRTDSYRIGIRNTLRALYRAPSDDPAHLAGHYDATKVAPTFAEAAADFAATYSKSPVDYSVQLCYRLAVLAPGEGAEGAPSSSALYGRGFAADLETLCRTLMETAEPIDVLLVVPHSEPADSERAEAILAIAEHYGLVTVDLRRVVAGNADLLHTEGANAGALNDAGHAACAAAIVDAIATAAHEGKSAPELPEERLYRFSAN